MTPSHVEFSLPGTSDRSEKTHGDTLLPVPPTQVHFNQSFSTTFKVERKIIAAAPELLMNIRLLCSSRALQVKYPQNFYLDLSRGSRTGSWASVDWGQTERRSRRTSKAEVGLGITIPEHRPYRKYILLVTAPSYLFWGLNCFNRPFHTLDYISVLRLYCYILNLWFPVKILKCQLYLFWN